MISAMTEVTAELGIANTTVAHVVARAGVSRRTFYELFDDRDQCFLAAREDALVLRRKPCCPRLRNSQALARADKGRARCVPVVLGRRARGWAPRSSSRRWGEGPRSRSSVANERFSMYTPLSTRAASQARTPGRRLRSPRRGWWVARRP